MQCRKAAFLSGLRKTASLHILKGLLCFYGDASGIIDRGVSQRFGPTIVSYRAPRGWQAVVRRGETQTLVVVHTFGSAPETVTLPVSGKIAAQFMRDGLTAAQTDGQLAVHGLTDFDAAAIILENEV